MSVEKQMHLTKIVHVIGEGSVGKTSLIDVLLGRNPRMRISEQPDTLKVKIGKHSIDFHFVESNECKITDQEDLYIIMFTEKTFKATSWYIQNKAPLQYHSVYVLNKVDEFINSKNYETGAKAITEAIETIAFISVKLRHNLNTIVTTLARQALHAYLPFYDFRAMPMLYKPILHRKSANPAVLIPIFEDAILEKSKITSCIRHNERLEDIKQVREEQEIARKALADYQRKKGHGVDRNRIRDVSEIKTEILLQHKTSNEYRDNMRLIRNCTASLRSVTESAKELEEVLPADRTQMQQRRLAHLKTRMVHYQHRIKELEHANAHPDASDSESEDDDEENSESGSDSDEEVAATSKSAASKIDDNSIPTEKLISFPANAKPDFNKEPSKFDYNTWKKSLEVKVDSPGERPAVAKETPIKEVQWNDTIVLKPCFDPAEDGNGSESFDWMFKLVLSYLNQMEYTNAALRHAGKKLKENYAKIEIYEVNSEFANTIIDFSKIDERDMPTLQRPNRMCGRADGTCLTLDRYPDIYEFLREQINRLQELHGYCLKNKVALDLPCIKFYKNA